jgi:hypothetical protein
MDSVKPLYLNVTVHISGQSHNYGYVSGRSNELVYVWKEYLTQE